MFKLIGLAGKAGSGKNALADYLQNELPEYYTQDSFALSIKLGLAAMLGIPLWELDKRKDAGDTHPLLGKTYRHMLQTLGTEWGRHMIHEDIWGLLITERILSNQRVDCIPIITDVRFDNEAALIHRLGGKVIYIDRPVANCRDVGTHVSETSLSPEAIDYTILNDSNELRNLYKAWNELVYLLAK